MLLKDLLDIEKLNSHIWGGIVSVQKHPEYPMLNIYNYTHVAQHDNVWDDVTELCRGLITEQLIVTGPDDTFLGKLENQRVLARPFRKFFNLNTSFRPETHEANLPLTDPRVLEKLDGSLGILYEYPKGHFQVATRGSFMSDQAQWASRWYSGKFYDGKTGDYFHGWPKGYTPLFEIIYKENRIVVDYADFEGLVLLGLVNTETGAEASPEVVEAVAKHHDLTCFRTYSKTLSQAKETNDANMEGFVLQYWTKESNYPLRVKVKTEDYVRLHKVITGLNPKGIWEHLKEGKNPDDLWYNVNQRNFTSWCTGWICTFQKMYRGLEDQAIVAFGRASIAARRDLVGKGNPSDVRLIRKSYAMAFKEAAEPNLLPVLFAMLDGKDYASAIWAQLEPKIQGKEAVIRNADEFNGL